MATDPLGQAVTRRVEHLVSLNLPEGWPLWAAGLRNGVENLRVYANHPFDSHPDRADRHMDRMGRAVDLCLRMGVTVPAKQRLAELLAGRSTPGVAFSQDVLTKNLTILVQYRGMSTNEPYLKKETLERLDLLAKGKFPNHQEWFHRAGYAASLLGLIVAARQADWITPVAARQHGNTLSQEWESAWKACPLPAKHPNPEGMRAWRLAALGRWLTNARAYDLQCREDGNKDGDSLGCDPALLVTGVAEFLPLARRGPESIDVAFLSRGVVGLAAWESKLDSAGRATLAEAVEKMLALRPYFDPTDSVDAYVSSALEAALDAFPHPIRTSLLVLLPRAASTAKRGKIGHGQGKRIVLECLGGPCGCDSATRCHEAHGLALNTAMKGGRDLVAEGLAVNYGNWFKLARAATTKAARGRPRRSG